MDKMWAGRFDKALDKQADDFNSSIHFDCRMYKQDITGSMFHAMMLKNQGIISPDEYAQILNGLSGILEDIENGRLEIDMEAEDIHMFVESVLTKRIGDAGKKLHTARSRNDQVALDIRKYLADECEEIGSLILNLIKAIKEKASENIDTIMPGYTHLQRAQPITFAHHILTYAFMLKRDYDRIGNAVERMLESCPIGSCALAGTTYNTDRYFEAERNGFTGVSLNSIDGVSDRDFCVELLADFSTIMMHLSRFSEEIILWSSWEFKFVELDDSYTTGSSIMPQKKNSDMAELVRGKTGRVYGDLFAMLTILKGIPLAYNKDMQEDKEAIFDAVDTVKKCLSIFAPMVATMSVLKENMYKAAGEGFINATDLADYLVKKGMPFRTAYKIVGEIVGYCIKEGFVLENLPIEKYKEFDSTFKEDLYNEISLETCVLKRISVGGTGPESVKAQIDYFTEFLNEKNIY
ncbi:MAG: argininosuccinate lyase [Ruminococcaceae bacterium]|nr:argininosuccinate lyase [Oscillospiraceae bacterium]